MEHNITREQCNALELYKDMITFWQKKVNLVANNDLKHLQTRHVEDSLQLLSFLNGKGKLLDIGSGGGFPAVVLAICSNHDIICVDSNSKKTFVLKEIINVLNLSNIRVMHSRIEDLDYNAEFDYVTSRAFGSLESLIKFSLKFLKIGGRAIFPRGSSFFLPIKDTEEFVIDIKESITDIKSKIVILTKKKEV